MEKKPDMLEVNTEGLKEGVKIFVRPNKPVSQMQAEMAIATFRMNVKTIFLPQGWSVIVVRADGTTEEIK